MPAYFGSFFSWMTTAVILGIICSIASLATNVFLGLWVYRDAESRNAESPALWGVMAALVPYYIGLIIYVCTRPKERGRLHCRTCGHYAGLKSRYCAVCGAPFVQESFEPIDNGRSRTMLIWFFISLGVTVLCGIGIAFAWTRGVFGLAGYSGGSWDVPWFDDYTAAAMLQSLAELL